MLLVMPPDEVTIAVSPVALNVWTRESAASNRMHPAGFLSGTTRNSMGAEGVMTAGVDGADACCVVHPATTAATATAGAKDVHVDMRICRLPSHCQCAS
jgi:hypothetical protein